MVQCNGRVEKWATGVVAVCPRECILRVMQRLSEMGAHGRCSCLPSAVIGENGCNARVIWAATGVAYVCPELDST